MKILVLDATTKVLKADLASNPTTNPDYVISYADSDTSTFVEASVDGALTGTTTATLLAGTAGSTKRIVKSITVYNRDSSSITVYLKLDNDGTVRIIEKIALGAGEVWHSDSQAGGGGTGRPSGSDTQVQFNDAGVFGGSSGLIFDKTTTTLTAANLTVSGALTVNGTTTNINSTNLVVEDKNIVIGDVTSPTNTTADGGGITLLGATNKTIVWDNANSNWTSSEHWNLASGKEFKVNNVSLLNATTLGSTVVSSSLTSLGTLTSLTVSGAASLATTSGNVGIGTSSPAAKLDIRGAPGADYGIANVFDITTAASGVGGVLAFSGYKTSTTGAAIFSKIKGIKENATSGSEAGALIFETNSGSAYIERMRVESSGNVLPGANGTQNFGSSSLRWNTIFTSDLSLSNGIGDWTIVEGLDDLFIYNNKRNTVYKFKLEAVDPAVAVPKREV